MHPGSASWSDICRLDFDNVSPRVGANPSVQATAAEGALLPLVRVGGGVRLALRDHIVLDLGPAVDVDFAGTRYVVAGGSGGALVDFAPWPVRPALNVGLSFR
jgi:hypothetical protein